MLTKPPFGYFKNKNTGTVEIVEEHAEIIKTIFDLYINNHGIKFIANYLNEKGISTPRNYLEKLFGMKLGYSTKKLNNRYFWNNTTVKRLLQNEIYTGTLVCRTTSSSRINKTFKQLPPEEHYRHENFVPKIISKEQWEQVQFLMSERKEKNVRAGTGKPIHRYTGLLKCLDCGLSLTAKMRRYKNKPDRVEYICSGSHRYGKNFCTQHFIREEDLDNLIVREIMSVKEICHADWNHLNEKIKEWTANKVSYTE